MEAVQAVSMLHNQSYKDRVLVVRMDRSEKKRESKLRLPPGLKTVGMGLGPDGAPLKDVTSELTNLFILDSIRLIVSVITWLSI